MDLHRPVEVYRSNDGAWIDGSSVPIDLNGPRTRPFHPFDEALLEAPMVELFRASARHHATRIAIDDGAVRLTYQAAWDACLHLSHRIAAETAPGSLVGILLPTCAAFPIAMLACLAAGRPFVAMDAHYPPQWIAQVIEDARLTAVIGRFGDAAAETLPVSGLRRIDVAPSFAGAPPADGAPPPVVPIGPDDPAVVFYTSGSTGRPKGIVNSQRNVLRRVEQFINAAHINQDDRLLSLTSDCTVAGMRDRLAPLLAGGTAHMIDAQRASAREIAAALHRDRITIIWAVPGLMRSIVQLSDAKAPDSLRVVRLGGDATLGTDIELLRRWIAPSCVIEVGYGATEAQLLQWFVPPDFPTTEGKVPVGYPKRGSQFAIQDDAQHPVAVGDIGELVVRSPYVALGRLIEGQCDGSYFPTDPLSGGCRIHRTGDLARLRPDGLVELLGRKDRQLKIRGQLVEPAEVESAILRWPGVRDAVVIGRRTADRITLIGYVVADDDAPARLLDDLRAHLRGQLPPQLRPHRLYLLPAIPRMASTKPDLHQLGALDAERQRAEAAAFRAGSATQSDGSVEQTIAAIWQTVLQQPDIPHDADFFDLGGDSLALLQITFEIERRLGLELPITVIYEARTIASLAAAIEAQDTGGYTPLVLMKAGNAGPPLFIVHGRGGNVAELFPLGRAIDHAGPVYAIQSRGLDGMDAPATSIPAMAQDYWAAIRSVQPNGPYYVAGYSLGGLVALELARLIRTEGAAVGLLALLDTVTNQRQWPLGVWMHWFGSRIGTHLETLRRRPVHEWGGYLRHAIGAMRVNVLWRLGRLSAAERSRPAAGLPTPLVAVSNANATASAAYRPDYYPGTLTLISSALGDRVMCDPGLIWRGRADEVKVHRVPGSHFTMVDGDNAREVARVLSGCLKAAMGKTAAAV